MAPKSGFHLQTVIDTLVRHLIVVCYPHQHSIAFAAIFYIILIVLVDINILLCKYLAVYWISPLFLQSYLLLFHIPFFIHNA